MRLCFVLGTRPEIIKMAPIIRAAREQGRELFVIHTGQHYSYEMDRIFFKDLELPDAEYNLNVGSGSHGQQTGRILQGIESILLKDRPSIVLVQGDTNSVLAGALAAAKIGIDVGHVEGGLRSFDRTMPEEINRIMADHISDLLFPPTETSKGNLLAEGIDEHKVHVVGNTVVDAVLQNIKISERRSSCLSDLGLDKKRYILVTLHRQENVDSPERLRSMTDGLTRVSESTGLPVILPLHPRTRKNMQSFGIVPSESIRTIEPVGYLDFLQLESYAKMTMTDSGGIQEESCILKVPCVTMRDSTERPETVEVGANVLAGADARSIENAASAMLVRSGDWKCPLGKGDTARRILDILIARYD